MERTLKLSNIWQQLNPICQKTTTTQIARTVRFFTALHRTCRSGAPRSRCGSVQCQFTNAWLRTLAADVCGLSAVTSHCGSGPVFSLRRSGRWCRFLLWMCEMPSGHPWTRLPLLLSCFQCRCARLCTPAGKKEPYLKK